MKDFLKNIIPQNRVSRIFWIGLVMLAFIFGWISRNDNESHNLRHFPSGSRQTSEITSWTCSMHPQIQQPKPGKCPICGMDLIPLFSQYEEENPRQLYLSESARKLAEVEVAAVERKYVSKEIRMVGKIEYDETRLKHITARIPGRIDRLYVNYTGIPVRKGDHLVEIYSPELLSTQQELVESLTTLDNLAGKEFPEMGKLAARQLASVKERLRLWGLTENQIAELQKTRRPTDQMTIFSPSGGIVVEKNALEGTYLETGTRIYTIADLSKVWVKLDAYESDLPWLRYGQEVEFQTEAYPGKLFTGRIIFIDPVLNPQTRTVKVRVNVENPQTKLKPQMFVRATVKSKIASSGKVMDPDLVGKWISPMHPEVVKDHPGKCDVCGMALVKAEELGYVSSGELPKEAPLVIPATAPLITGKRAVVYVANAGKEGLYEGRDIVLGPRAGDYYLVVSGLKEGEKVVVRGNFKIDSAIQIKAGPSMMNPNGGGQIPVHHHGQETSQPGKPAANQKGGEEKRFTGLSKKFLHQLDQIFQAYFAIQQGLSQDKLTDAKNKAVRLSTNLHQLNMKLLSSEAQQKWMILQRDLDASVQTIIKSNQIESARSAFELLSAAIISTARFFDSEEHQLLVYHCPMAFDFKGADWLQNKEGTENPYFGSAMFSCGDQNEDLSTSTLKDPEEGHLHE